MQVLVQSESLSNLSRNDYANFVIKQFSIQNITNTNLGIGSVINDVNELLCKVTCQIFELISF